MGFRELFPYFLLLNVYHIRLKRFISTYDELWGLEDTFQGPWTKEDFKAWGMKPSKEEQRHTQLYQATWIWSGARFYWHYEFFIVHIGRLWPGRYSLWPPDRAGGTDAIRRVLGVLRRESAMKEGHPIGRWPWLSHLVFFGSILVWLFPSVLGLV